MGVLQTVTDLVQGKTKPGERRDPAWQKVKNEWLKDHHECAACGATTKLQVHHKNPFHLHPDQELDPNNFITLCETSNHGVICHLLFGHLGDYRSFNDNVVSDAQAWRTKIDGRPKDDDGTGSIV